MTSGTIYMICKTDWQQTSISRQRRQTWSEVFFLQVSANVSQFQFFCLFVSCFLSLFVYLYSHNPLVTHFQSLLFCQLLNKSFNVFWHVSLFSFLFFFDIWNIDLICPLYHKHFNHIWKSSLACKSTLILGSFFIVWLFSYTLFAPTYFSDSRPKKSKSELCADTQWHLN